MKKTLLLALPPAALLAGAYATYRTAFARSARREAGMRTLPPGEDFQRCREEILTNIGALLARPYETWRVRSYDGTELTGKYYAGKPGAPVVLFVHGYRSGPERDGNGGFQYCAQRGYGILLAAQRGHGASGGRTITFGVRERRDCAAWAWEAQRRLGAETPLLLLGVSMGAATVLMASDLPLPPAVRGIIADCGFSSPEAVLRATLRRWGWPVGPSYALLRLGARLFGGFDPGESSALSSLRRTRLPVLLIHGTEDPMVPWTQALRLRSACAGPVTLLTVPGAGHGISYYVDTPAYQAAVDRFCRAVLGGDDPEQDSAPPQGKD